MRPLVLNALHSFSEVVCDRLILFWGAEIDRQRVLWNSIAMTRVRNDSNIGKAVVDRNHSASYSHPLEVSFGLTQIVMRVSMHKNSYAVVWDAKGLPLHDPFWNSPASITEYSNELPGIHTLRFIYSGAC